MKYSWAKQSQGLVEKMVNIVNQGMYFGGNFAADLCIFVFISNQ